MTELEAVEKTIEMWLKLAETGWVKWEYFKKVGVSEYDTPLNGCYLCEYVKSGTCLDCPYWKVFKKRQGARGDYCYVRTDCSICRGVY